MENTLVCVRVDKRPLLARGAGFPIRFEVGGCDKWKGHKLGKGLRHFLEETLKISNPEMQFRGHFGHQLQLSQFYQRKKLST